MGQKLHGRLLEVSVKFKLYDTRSVNGTSRWFDCLEWTVSFFALFLIQSGTQNPLAFLSFPWANKGYFNRAGLTRLKKKEEEEDKEEEEEEETK